MSTSVRVAADASFVRGRASRHELLLGGVLGGVLAGAAAMAWVALSAAIAGRPPWRPLALVAASVTGEQALDGGAAVVLGGATLWAATSAALALPYAAVVPRGFPFASAALIGVGYSLTVMAVVTTLVLPRVNPLMRAEMPASGGAWVLAYAIYGVVIGVIPRLRRWWIA